MTPKYPDVFVKLSDEDGNAFAIMGRVRKEMRHQLREDGMSAAEITQEVNAFIEDATSGDYDHLLQTCMEWVEVG